MGNRKFGIVQFAVIVFGLSLLVPIGGWLDRHRIKAVDEESLYVSPSTAKRISLGFGGLVADWYWMRSLQYVGQKVINYNDQHKGNLLQMDDLTSLDLRQLPELLDITTTLDPKFMAAYEYGAMLLPSIDKAEAINLLQKGIASNPEAWRLYHHLGYIYWQGNDFQAAGQIYAKGADLPDAPPWMRAMGARLAAEGGSRETAREIYQRMLEQSDDQQVKEMAAKRLLQLRSIEERDVLRLVISNYKSRAGRCPSSWEELTPFLRATRLRISNSGVPIDPADTPYLLVKDGCDVDLDPGSRVPYR
jgi:tetratricopeptide (TPR) repeat protein